METIISDKEVLMQCHEAILSDPVREFYQKELYELIAKDDGSDYEDFKKRLAELKLKMEVRENEIISDFGVIKNKLFYEQDK